MAAGEGISWQEIPCCTEKPSRGTIDLYKVFFEYLDPSDPGAANQKKKTSLEPKQEALVKKMKAWMQGLK